MRGAITLTSTPQYAFLAYCLIKRWMRLHDWYLVKHRKNFTLTELFAACGAQWSGDYVHTSLHMALSGGGGVALGLASTIMIILKRGIQHYWRKWMN